MKTPSTLLWKILILVLMLILADLQMFRSAAYVPLALEIRAPTSVVESPSVVILLSRYTIWDIFNNCTPQCDGVFRFYFVLHFICFGVVDFQAKHFCCVCKTVVFFSARHGVCVIAWLYHQQIQILQNFCHGPADSRSFVFDGFFHDPVNKEYEEKVGKQTGLTWVNILAVRVLPEECDELDHILIGSENPQRELSLLKFFRSKNVVMKNYNICKLCFLTKSVTYK